VTGLAPLPDVEAVLIALFVQQYPEMRACSNLPADLAQQCPLLQVRRVTGAAHVHVHDQAIVDVHAYALTDEDSSQLARQAEVLLLNTRNTTFADANAVLGNVESVSRPAWRAYPNTTVVLYAATYSIKLRAARSTT
jgi:hypothetical protein